MFNRDIGALHNTSSNINDISAIERIVKTYIRLENFYEIFGLEMGELIAVLGSRGVIFVEEGGVEIIFIEKDFLVELAVFVDRF